MMLACKAWRESRVRFFVGAGVLIWFCAIFVVLRSGIRQAVDKPFGEFVANTVYGTGIRSLYVIFIVILGMGGVLQERALGTAGFTLALPVRRVRLVGTRAAVGLLEVVALATCPSLVVCALAPAVHQSYPLAQALERSARWSAGGTELFAGAFFFSSVIGPAYGALTVSMAALAGYSVFVNVPPFDRFPSLNVFELMGDGRLDPGAVVAAPLLAAMIIAAAALVIERQDF